MFDLDTVPFDNQEKLECIDDHKPNFCGKLKIGNLYRVLKYIGYDNNMVVLYELPGCWYTYRFKKV